LGGGGSGIAARPSTPNISRPSLPSAGTRPSARPPGALNPITRPGSGGGGIAGGGRPSFPGGGDRPSFGGIDRPGTGGVFPGGGTRPGAGGGIQNPIAGGGIRPGAGGGGIERPSTLPGIRPGAGGGGIERPGIRPGGGGDRPIIGGGGTRPGQGGGGIQNPIAGGGGDRPFRPGDNTRPFRPGGNDGNINIGGDVNIGNDIGNRIDNRPGWGINSRPGSDWWGQNHDWANHWHDHCIHDHHDWYHGCWNNHWGSNWYAPLAWGAVGWGLGSWYGGSYGGSYYNPYYDTAVPAAYDYSRPVVVQNYVTTDADAGGATSTALPTATAQAQPPPANQQALTQFDAGLASFKSGNYQQALTQFEGALKQLPSDPVVHEVRALSLFALGRYPPAAAALNSLLSAAPGMDWTTMSSLYGSVDDYTTQLRNLEAHCKSHPQDASAYFVLAYHYLVTGHQDDAVQALKIVVAQQPKDATAKRMLDSLAPPAQAVAAAPTPTPATPTPATPAPATAAPTTDLVGKWLAKAGTSTIELTITDDSQFTWKAAQQGQQPIELKGSLAATAGTLVLDNPQQGSMVGSVKSGGADKWQFVLNGSQPGDAGISFERVKG